MPTITRAISIRQPLVEQILRGQKKVEYRSRKTNIRERVYLYASATPFEDAKAWRKVNARPGELASTVIVGTVEITDCVWSAANGCYAYRLAKPRRLNTPLKPKNQPQPVFWRPQFR